MTAWGACSLVQIVSTIQSSQTAHFVGDSKEAVSVGISSVSSPEFPSLWTSAVSRADFWPAVSASKNSVPGSWISRGKGPFGGLEIGDPGKQKCRSSRDTASSKCRIWTRSIASFYRNFKRDLQMMHILVSALTICILANSAQTRAQESLVNYKILGSWTCFRSSPSRARRLSETRRQAAIRLLVLTEADIR
jgi:hypothetical protein